MPTALNTSSHLVNTQTLILPSPIYNDIVVHANEGKPKEICGLLRGRNSLAKELVRSKNVASNPILDYEVDPETLLILFDWEEAGDELIAIYHRHPAGPAYPSGSDAFKAYYPETVFLICSLLDEDEPVLRGFFLRELLGEIDLEAIQNELVFDETRPGRWAAYLPDYWPRPPSLTCLNRPPEQALYIVYQKQTSYPTVVRAVTVQEVAIVIK
jgi:proteasome lid subunit RPN8/RPN11